MIKRFSFADAALNTVLIVMAAATAALLLIYILRGSPQDESSAEVGPPHVIGMETEAPVTTVSETETQAAVSEATTAVSAEPAAPPAGNYDPAFFDKAFFIGDSLSVGLINYEFLKPENVFAQAGITPSSITKTLIDNVSVYQKVSDFAPDYICIMLGTNGLSYLKTNDMSQKLGDFIDELKKLCPEAKIAVVSIPPVTKKHEEEKPEKLYMITEYNESIKKLAEDKSVAFADAFTLLKDETGYLGPDYAEHDGLHLKIHAYPVILSAVENAVFDFYGEQPIPEETTTETALSNSNAAETAVNSSTAGTSATSGSTTETSAASSSVSETSAASGSAAETSETGGSITETTAADSEMSAKTVKESETPSESNTMTILENTEISD